MPGPSTCPVFVQAERRPDPAESGGGPLRLCGSSPSFPAPSPGRRPETRRAPLRGSSVTLGAGAPRQSEAAALSAMLLTFCSCSRRDCRHPRLLLLRLEASFSAAGERSAMSGKFREGLAGAMLPGLSCRRPPAALCTR